MTALSSIRRFTASDAVPTPGAMRLTDTRHEDLRDQPDRMYSPVETYARFAPFMTRCGVTRVADITGLDNVGIPVFAAVRPNSRGLSTTHGSGLDPDTARAAALVAAIGSWHAETFVGPAHFVRGAEAEAACGLRTIDVRGLTRRGADDDWWRIDRTPWVVGRDLLAAEADAQVLVPLDAVSTDFTGQHTATPIIRSNVGLAGGNTTTEALVNALYQVIEHDAVARWKRSADSGVVDLFTVDDHNGELIERLIRADLAVRAEVVDNDLGVRIFAVSIAPDGSAARFPSVGFTGFGAHLDPSVALARAITEAAQNRLMMIHGGRDDLWPSIHARSFGYGDPTASTLFAADPKPNRSMNEMVNGSQQTLSADLNVLVALLRFRSQRVVAVDLTRPEFELPVVKVVVTGMSGSSADHRNRVEPTTE